MVEGDRFVSAPSPPGVHREEKGRQIAGYEKDFSSL